ncbi:MAG: hypothetical protein GC192_02495 [Bacteroidetes bacterium]|nr:hypothetical protein [Bacteroidota bacterium]
METADCQVGEGQVEDSASYDFLPLGVYNLELVLKNTVSSSGTLTVTNDKYTLEIEDGYGFMANEATLMRVPTESVWGYVAYKDNQHLTTADEFLSVLNLKTSNLKLGKGNYNYFSIGGNDKLSLDKAPDYNNFKTFYRKSTGQNTELIKLLEDYRTQYPSGEMEFKIFTSQGETL